MNRRDLMIGLGGAVIARPLTAGAQQKALPIIGYLSVGSLESDDIPERLVAFRQGLYETGYVEGGNVAIEYRWAESKYDRLPALAADLVRRPANVIVAPGAPSAFAARAATATVPIVFNIGIDPVQSGLVASFSRPGGNITGVSILGTELTAKRLEFLRELLPALTIVGFLANPGNPNIEPETKSLEDAARSLGLEVHVVQTTTLSEVQAAFETLAGLRAGALVVSTDLFFTSHRAQIIALATRHTIPTIYAWRLFPAAGGLMSYGPDLADGYRQLGQYTAKILNGAKPAELPVQQVVRIELVINLKTAGALGLTVARSVLARADEVIE